MLYLTDDDQGYKTQPLARAAVYPHTWLWEPYLPLGSFVLLDGDPGVGKTFVAMDLAARLSRGNAWPDGSPGRRPFATIFFPNHYDDGLLKPRAEAAGADLDKVLSCRDTARAAPAVPRDRDLLAKMFVDHRAVLAVVDPLPLVLAAAVGSHAPTAWHGLEPLQYTISRTDTVVLLVRHRTKLGRGPALFRGLGGVSLAGAARSALLVARHPDDPDLRLLVHTKSNFGPLGPTLGFRIVDNAVRWEGPIDLSAEELGAVPDVERTRRPRERAAEWLKGELANGPRKAAELIEAAKTKGIPEATLRRAKRLAKVHAEQRHDDQQHVWLWRCASSRSCQSETGSGMQVNALNGVAAEGVGK
jgi:AAA domain